MSRSAFSIQRGVALPVALILLVVITLLALSGIRLSTMELRMALNDELRINSFEQAQSVVDSTVRNFNNTPILADNVTICARAAPPLCTDVSVTLPPGVYDTELAKEWINVIIRGIPPLNAEPPVGTGYSLANFDAAYLQVTGIYDRNLDGLGRTTINEGIAVVYGQAGEITTQTGTPVNPADDPYAGATS